MQCGMSEVTAIVVLLSIHDLCGIHLIINYGEGIKLHEFVANLNFPRPNQVYGHLFPRCNTDFSFGQKAITLACQFVSLTILTLQVVNVPS